MKTSPSRLVYVEACPKFKPTPFQNDAANEGIDLHSALEDMVLSVKPWEYLDWVMSNGDARHWTNEQKSLLCKAAEQLCEVITSAFDTGDLIPDAYPDYSLTHGSVSHSTSMHQTGLYPEAEVEVGPNRKGYIDLLILNRKNEAVIVDYKFVRSSSDFELQLAAYAVTVKRLLPSLKSIKSVIIAPYLTDADNAELTWTYNEESLDKYRAIIDKIDESVDDPNCFPKPGSHCERCKFNGKCVYQAKTVGFGLDFSVSRLAEILQANNDEDRALRRDFMKCAEALVASIKDDDKAYFDKNPDAELPGWKKTMMAGRTTLDKDQASAVNEAILSSFQAVKPRDILDIAVPDVTQLAELISFRTGFPTDNVMSQLRVVLEPFMKRGSSYVVLRKKSTKQRVTK